MTTLKTSYGGASSFTWTLAALATDSNLLIGRQSTVVDNTSTLADDYLIEGIITTTTAATANTVVEIWCFASIDAGTTYTASAGASDASLTPGTTGIKNLMALVVAIQQTDTAAHTYNFGPYSVANLFGGLMPDHFGLFCVHNTGVNIASGSAKFNAVTYTNV